MRHLASPASLCRGCAPRGAYPGRLWRLGNRHQQQHRAGRGRQHRRHRHQQRRRHHLCQRWCRRLRVQLQRRRSAVRRAPRHLRHQRHRGAQRLVVARALHGHRRRQQGGRVLDCRPSAVAGVDNAGTVTATNKQGGDVAVKATFNAQTASASVKVTLKKVLNPGGISDPDQAVLTGAVNPDSVSVVWAYPYNGTVFPKGLLAPEMMWNGSGAGDQYYVHVKSKYADFEFFTKADPPSRYSIDDASWEQLTESGPGGDIAVHVARMPAGKQTAGVVVDHTWKIANGSLRGTVYYWANSLGRVVRIKPGAKAPDDFLVNDVGLSAGGCTTCHAVSSNGSTLVIGGDDAASVVDLLSNKVSLSLTSVGKPVRNWAHAGDLAQRKGVDRERRPAPRPPAAAMECGTWRRARRSPAPASTTSTSTCPPSRRTGRRLPMSITRRSGSASMTTTSTPTRCRTPLAWSPPAATPTSTPSRSRASPGREVDCLSPRAIPRLARHPLWHRRPLPRQHREARRRDHPLQRQRRRLPVRRRGSAIASSTTSPPSPRSTPAGTCGLSSRRAAPTVTAWSPSTP